MNKTQANKLLVIRKAVEVEKKKLRITEPKYTIQLDSKTGKLLLSYSVPVDVGLDDTGDRIIRKKQKKKYLPNATINDLDYVVNNVQSYADMVSNEISKTIKRIGGDKDSLGYWKNIYDNPNRTGTIELSPTTVVQDVATLNELIEYIEDKNPKMLNIWEWVDHGRDFLTAYMKHKQKVGGKKKILWSNGSVNSQYRRLRAFFNFVSTNLKGYPFGFMNRMPFAKTKIETITFTSTEIKLVKSFMDDEVDNLKWKWFIPILHTLIETGCRVSEVCKLLIRDLDIEERKISVVGKGKKRFLYLKSDSLWNRLEPYIFSANGKIRTDKEYIFHSNRAVASYGKYFEQEDLTKGYSTSGVQHKFKDMVRHLKLNPKLSTHCTRRFYITEMLKKTSGDIPLVAQLVGHNTWDVVRLYTKDLIDENKQVNVGLFD
jgi:integrase